MVSTLELVVFVVGSLIILSSVLKMINTFSKRGQAPEGVVIGAAILTSYAVFMGFLVRGFS